MIRITTVCCSNTEDDRYTNLLSLSQRTNWTVSRAWVTGRVTMAPCQYHQCPFSERRVRFERQRFSSFISSVKIRRRCIQHAGVWRTGVEGWLTSVLERVPATHWPEDWHLELSENREFIPAGIRTMILRCSRPLLSHRNDWAIPTSVQHFFAVGTQ